MAARADGSVRAVRGGRRCAGGGADCAVHAPTACVSRAGEGRRAAADETKATLLQPHDC